MLAVKVPASTSNLGAGFDCIGIAIDLWLEARLIDGAGESIYTGTLEGIDPAEDLVARRLTEGVNQLSDRRLEVRSDIPVAKGLGSSAAALVAGFALSQLASGSTVDRDAVWQLTAKAEGHPDNAGPAVFGGAILAAGRPVTIPLHRGIALAFAVPQTAIGTKAARAILPETVARADAVAQASRAAALIAGLQSGDPGLIHYGMEDRLAVPYRKELIAGFDAATEAGQAAGAYGVTISGAGSTLVAITENSSAEDVAKAMAEALTRHDNPATVLTPRVTQSGLTIIA